MPTEYEYTIINTLKCQLLSIMQCALIGPEFLHLCGPLLYPQLSQNDFFLWGAGYPCQKHLLLRLETFGRMIVRVLTKYAATFGMIEQVFIVLLFRMPSKTWFFGGFLGFFQKSLTIGHNFFLALLNCPNVAAFAPLAQLNNLGEL